MGKNWKSPQSIVNYIEMILAVVIGGLIASLVFPADNVSKIQVVHTAVYAYVIITHIVVASITLKEGIPKYTGIIIAVIAVILYTTAGGLLIESAVKHRRSYIPGLSEDWYERTLSAGIISIILALLYIVDIGLAFQENKKEMTVN